MKKTLWSKTAAILVAFVILLTFGACGSKQAKDYGAMSTYTADGTLNETAGMKAESKAFSGAPEQADSPKLT
ncbi:MAG: hypothetical protein II473_00090, partial [Clostridia bacterium]|nr:hypothetical protein [Clostridia bacterium]